MKYPNIVFFRYDKYKDIDNFFKTNENELFCNLNITNKKEDLNKLYDANYHLLVTYGDSVDSYIEDVNSVICGRMHSRWIHYSTIDDPKTFSNNVNYCFTKLITSKQYDTRPIFSIFTTCYKSYEKIIRAYNSVTSQTLKDWEWVILDDSPEDKHFDFLRETFKNDKRIRLYKGRENNGSIGHVKNEVVMLCRGRYVIELDHDDEIMPDVLADSAGVFENNNTVGFIYMDYSNIYEDGSNYHYSDGFSLGYAGYYLQKYNNRWIYVASTPNVNNVTLSHIVAIPNHPRIWRCNILLEMGNYSEFLPISDDYELFLRTAVHTKIVRIHKLGYIQYMNNGANNFSLIRNSEINRLCTDYLKPICYNDYKVEDTMKELNAFEEYNYDPIWKRENYVPKYCNEVINVNYKKQICIIGWNILITNFELITELYKDSINDFLVLENKMTPENLAKLLDGVGFSRMKCYALECNTDELEKYFHTIYQSCDDVIVIRAQIFEKADNI